MYFDGENRLFAEEVSSSKQYEFALSFKGLKIGNETFQF